MWLLSTPTGNWRFHINICIQNIRKTFFKNKSLTITCYCEKSLSLSEWTLIQNVSVFTEHYRPMEDCVLHPSRHLRSGSYYIRHLRLGRTATVELSSSASGETGRWAAYWGEKGSGGDSVRTYEEDEKWGSWEWSRKSWKIFLTWVWQVQKCALVHDSVTI